MQPYIELGGRVFSQQELNKAKNLMIDRIEANGSEVDEARAVAKSRDAILVYVKVDGSDAERVGVITRADLLE